jgi:intracellular sulfur oxidation DsrE/DsrF family protein
MITVISRHYRDDHKNRIGLSDSAGIACVDAVCINDPRRQSNREVVMHRPLLPLLFALFVIPAAGSAATSAAADFWQTPTITAAGKMHPLPQAAYQPDRKVTYKVVFGLTRGSDKPDEVNPALDRVARAVNLYTGAGVPLSHLKFVAVAYGPATELALNDEQYRKLHNVANPNLPMIAQLRKAGVDVTVCGQAWAEHKFQYDWIDSHVTLALSALTTITVLQQRGYALVPL